MRAKATMKHPLYARFWTRGQRVLRQETWFPVLKGRVLGSLSELCS